MSESLELRARPIQQRGIERFEAILAAARGVLVDNGLEHFTIEDVAARARVPVGSVYQYFPNKFALVAEIANQDTAAIVTAIEAAAPDFPSADWQRLTDDVLVRMADRWAEDPWRAAVFSAMRSNATTRARADENTRRIAAAATVLVLALTPTLSQDRLEHVTLVLVETCQTLLHLTVSSGRLDEATLAELQRLVRAYLRAVAIDSQESGGGPGRGSPSASRA